MNHHRVRVVVENWTVNGVERVEGPWRNVPPGMPPEKVCARLFQAALGDVRPGVLPKQIVAQAEECPADGGA